MTSTEQKTELDILLDKVKELYQAKNNVRKLLDEPNCTIDMHGLDYWTGRVIHLRNELKGSL